MATFTQRLLGAAKLDVSTFEEVEADQSATPQALSVVVVSSIASSVGGGYTGIGPLIGLALVALLAWIVWAAIIYLVGTRLLAEPQTKADTGELLRTLGFAATPGFLNVLGVIPVLGGFLRLAASVWMLVAMIIAVRQALDYESTGRAIVVCVIGWVFYVAGTFLLLVMLGIPR